MKVANLSLKKEFPYGLNIHFAMNLSELKIVFLHQSFSWIISDTGSNPGITQLSNTIKSDFIPSLTEAFNNLLEGKFTGSLSICTQNERWIRITPFLFGEDDKTLLMATLEEITDTIGNDSVVTKYANKKNSILHMLGHDLRGPLGAAKALLNTMGRREDPNQHIKISHISKIIEQSIGLIHDLTQREMLDSMEVILVKKRYNIVKILGDYMEECKRSDHLSERSFGFHSAGDEIYVDLDNSKFMQVINNIISNSLKFTRPGGHIDLFISETSASVELQLKDDGIGIPKHLLPVLFEKYTPAARPGLDGEPTMGLGMSIIKMIIGWHNGSIYCESEEGKGTTLFISLPKEAAAE